MKGRPPKTLEQRAADGDTRKLGRKKHEEAVDSGVPVERGFPPCPEYLDADASDAWAYWAPRLAQAGIDYAVAAPALEAACVQVSRIRECGRAIAEDGLFMEVCAVVKGEVVSLGKKKHPAEQVAARAYLLLKAFMIEFGMTPLSRARVSNAASEKGTPNRRTEEALRELNASINRPRKLNFIPVQ